MPFTIKRSYIIIISIILATVFIIGIIIFFAINNTPSEPQYTDNIYDPISKETYSNINQESEGDEKNNNPVYMGFQYLFTENIPYETYLDFINSTNNYIVKNNLSEIKYVSLLAESVKKTNNTYTFTIYFNSKNPVNVTMQTAPDFEISYSKP